MNALQMTAMAEATRLTREGRLAEATALIQQTLAGPAAPQAPWTDQESDTPGRQPGPRPALPAGRGTLPGQGHPGSPPRHRVVPGRVLPDIRRLLRPEPPVAEPLPGRFDSFSYTGAAGTRSYRLYVPASGAGGSLPLIVMLHGGTQDAASFAAATAMNKLAEREKFLVAYPEQPRSANPGGYWNWFDPAHQHRDAGEPSLIAGITAQVTSRCQADPARVHVAGFSAGGAMAAVMAAAYPDLYAAAGVHSGLAYAAATDLPSALQAMRQGPAHPARRPVPSRPVPLIVFHGGQDATVAPVNAAGLIGHVLTAAGHDGRAGARPATVTDGQVPGGHAYTRASYQDPAGAALAECWMVHQGGHAWFGGVPHASHTDAHGPDASAEFVRFFSQHPARPQKN